jgi:hypothetical protein
LLNPLNAYPIIIKIFLLDILSLQIPKYVLLNAANVSAIPSTTPIPAILIPILLKYRGIIGYNISEATSVKKLIKDTYHIFLFKKDNFIPAKVVK